MTMRITMTMKKTVSMLMKMMTVNTNILVIATS